MTVNITCHVCDGRRLCDACRNAARTLSSAGFLVEHSTRYAALRAAATGSYGFDACIVPVDPGEHAVVDAATALFAGKRLAFVADQASGVSLGNGAAVFSRKGYDAGEFDLAWLTDAHREISEQARVDEIATMPGSELDAGSADGADRAHATRRLKRIADATRMTVAQAGLASAPRLDLLAVLDDEVAWARASGSAFGVLLVHLHGIAATKTGEAAAAAEKRVRDAEDIAKRAVRATDVVAARGDDFLVVLSDAGAEGVELAAQRIASAIVASGLRAAVKQRRSRGFAAWSVGRATFPEDGATRDALLARATATLTPIEGAAR